MARHYPVHGRTHSAAGQVWPALLVALTVALALLMSIASAQAQLSDPKFPALTGRIVDEARLLKPEDRAAIEAELAALEGKSTDQLAVLTVNSLQGFEIEDFGYKLGRAWGIGQKDKNNGVILIVAPKERKVRIEVGRGLEPIMTDTMSSIIINNAILPAFRRGDFSGGIRAAVRDMKDVLLGDAEAVKQRAKGRKPPGPDMTGIIFLAIWVAILLFIIYANYRQSKLSPHTVGRRGRRFPDDHIVIIPGGGGWGGGSGHWGGGSGGGGWSGGGGDFGGGGSSGSW